MNDIMHQSFLNISPPGNKTVTFWFKNAKENCFNPNKLFSSEDRVRGKGMMGHSLYLADRKHTHSKWVGLLKWNPAPLKRRPVISSLPDFKKWANISQVAHMVFPILVILKDAPAIYIQKFRHWRATYCRRVSFSFIASSLNSPWSKEKFGSRLDGGAKN